MAAPAGLDPYCKDIGTHRGERHIRGGRAPVRTVLDMAAPTAVRCNPVITEDITRFTATGTMRKVAMSACVRNC